MLPTFRPSASEADRAKLYTSMAELERQGRLGQKQLSNLASVRALPPCSVWLSHWRGARGLFLEREPLEREGFFLRC